MHNVSGYEQNIWKLKLYSFFTKFLFYSPIIIAFFKSLNFSVFQILLLFSISSFISFVLEIPSGYYADKYGRKNSLLFATFTLLLSSLIFWFASAYSLFIIAAILLGISGAFRSGADTALLYDTLIILKKEDEHKKIQGSILAYNAWALTLASLSSSLIVLYLNMRYTFLISVIFFCIAFLVTITIMEPKHLSHDNKTKISIIDSIKECFSNKKLLMITLFSIGTFLFIDVSQKFDQMYYLLLNIDLKWFGVLFGTFTVLSGIATKYSHVIEKSLGMKKSILLMIFIPVCSFIFLGLNATYFGLIAILLVNIIWGISKVITLDYSQKLIKSQNRATVLSIQNQIFSIFYIVIPLFLGYVADLVPVINKIYLVMALLIIVLSSYPAYYFIKNYSE